jgi:hypothetical protein
MVIDGRTKDLDLTPVPVWNDPDRRAAECAASVLVMTNIQVRTEGPTDGCKDREAQSTNFA